MTLIPPLSSITNQVGQWSLEGKKTQPTDPTGGFGSMLTNAIGALEKTQKAAATQSQALATGQTQDVSSVITAVQEASLSMQLATQVRSRAVEAYTALFQTQV